MSARSVRTIEIILAVFIVVVHLYVVFAPPNSLINWFTTDDAFYYFKVAQNITEGHGSTFDGFSPTNGYHPLWMLVCIPLFALARFDLLLPLRLVVLIMAGLNAGAVVILFRLLRKVVSVWVALFGAIFWGFFTSIHAITTKSGMESGINAFAVILFVYLFTRFEERRKNHQDTLQDVLWLSAAAVFALLSRLDNIFLLGIFGLLVIFRNRSLRLLLVGDLVIILAAVYGSYLIRLGFSKYFFYEPTALYLAVALVVFRLLSGWIFGLYNPQLYQRGWKNWLRIPLAVSVASIPAAGVMLGLQAGGMIIGFPRSALLVEWAISLTAFGLLRWVASLLERRDANEAEVFQFTLQWRHWLARGLAFFGPLAAVLIIYLGINLAFAGTPSPVSGQVKRWWGTIYTVYGKPARNLVEITGVSPQGHYDRDAWALPANLPMPLAEDATLLFHGNIEDTGPTAVFYQGAYRFFAVLLSLIALLGLINFKRLGRMMNGLGVLPLLVGSLVHAQSYYMTGYVGMKVWYWVAQDLLMTLVLVALIESAVQLVKPVRLAGWAFAGLGMLMALFIVAQNLNLTRTIIPYQIEPGYEEGYLEGVHALEEATEPGSLIGSTGGGIIAYFIDDRTIVNLDGLINSYEYFELVQAGRGGEYLDRIGLDYVYGAYYIVTYSEPYIYIFEDRLKYLGDIAWSAFYRYTPGN